MGAVVSRALATTDAVAVVPRQVLVWKELDYGHMREKEKQLVVSEVNILRELRHPFIVRYYDRIIDKASTRIYIVMEFCEGGDLGRVIRKCKRDSTFLEEDFVWKCFAQMVLALKECHRHREGDKVKPILHRDLKPGNIFLDSAQNIKIGDFGLAKELASESKYAQTNVGTPFYMSPEQINELKYNEKSDIWALGCLLYEMCALAPPFDATNQLSLAVKINAGKFARIPTQYSEDLHRAIRWMIQVDASKRPAVEDLERIPNLAPFLRDASAILREYTTGQRAAAAAAAAGAAGGAAGRATGGAAAAAPTPKELAVREEALRKAEDDVARRQTELDARERALNEREASIAARERAVGASWPSAFTAGAGLGLPASARTPTPTAAGGDPVLPGATADSHVVATQGSAAYAPPAALRAPTGAGVFGGAGFGGATPYGADPTPVATPFLSQGGPTPMTSLGGATAAALGTFGGGPSAGPSTAFLPAGVATEAGGAAPRLRRAQSAQHVLPSHDRHHHASVVPSAAGPSAAIRRTTSVAPPPVPGMLQGAENPVPGWAAKHQPAVATGAFYSGAPQPRTAPRAPPVAYSAFTSDLAPIDSPADTAMTGGI